jgi:hypothetical protein
MTLSIYQLPRERVHHEWKQIADVLSTLEKQDVGECTLDQLKVGLINGGSIALVIADESMAAKSVIVGEWNMTPGKRVFFVTQWAGSNSMNEGLSEDLYRWIYANGGTHIQGAVRDSVGRMMTKLWQWEKVYSIYEKEIKI